MCSLYRQNGVLVFAENVLTEKEDEEKNVYFAPILFLHENCEQIIVVLQGNSWVADTKRAIDEKQHSQQKVKCLGDERRK